MTRRVLDQTLPIYQWVGLGHWAVYKNAEENPEYPWFAEHRLVDNEADLRYDHDDDDSHEYGSFATWREAFDSALGWYETECRSYEDNREWEIIRENRLILAGNSRESISYGRG